MKKKMSTVFCLVWQAYNERIVQEYKGEYLQSFLGECPHKTFLAKKTRVIALLDNILTFSLS